MNSIFTKIPNLIKRAVITKVNSDNDDIANCQIDSFDTSKPMETIYPYGMSANAPIDNIALVFSVGGNEANAAGMPYSQQNRFKNLKSGEVVFGNPVVGSYVKFNEDGSITIYSPAAINVNCDGDFKVSSQQNVDFSGTVGTNIFNNLQVLDASVSKLLATNASKMVASSNLISWVHSSTLTVTDDTIGGVNINLSGSYEPAIAAGTSSQYWRGDKTWQTLNTAAVAELTNLYYTDARARSSVSSSTTGLTYTSSTGVFSLTTGYVIPTTTEESNWNTAYSTSVSNWTLPLSYSSGTVSMTQANTSTNGWLSSTDWNTFNNKQNALGYTPLQAGTASVYLTPANPTALTSTSYLMFGLGSTLAFTPSVSTKVRFSIKYVPGGVGTTGLNSFKLAYGTGAAPANGAAATGTIVGGVDQGGAVASVNVTPAINQRNVIISSLTPGVAYWFDIQGAKNAAHTNVGIFSIEATIQELSF
jgi:hypothetical protein